MTDFNQRSTVGVQAILYTGENAEAVITAGEGVIFPGRQGRLMIDPPANPRHATQGDTRAAGHIRDNLSSVYVVFPDQYVVHDTTEIDGVARNLWYALDKAVFEALYVAA